MGGNMTKRRTRLALLRAYTKRHGALKKPRQGWESLHPSLHLAYSMGRVRGFTDLGTYADKAGDHGHWPARAFDLGRKDNFMFRGFGYLRARRFCNFLVKNADALDIRYVILGDRIWHRHAPTWGPFRNYSRDKSHDYHIHVSGQCGRGD